MSTKKTIAFALAVACVIVGGAYYMRGSGESNGVDGTSSSRYADIAPKEGLVDVYYFYSTGCPYCAQQAVWLDEMEERYDNLHIVRLNISKYARLFSEFLELYDVPIARRGGVPATFISEEYFPGFNSETGDNMEEKIIQCLETENCVSLWDGEK